jgi:hypothetical protein
MAWEMGGVGRTRAGPGDTRHGYHRSDRLQPEAVKTFYQRLCGLGKAKKADLVACMQKLLTTRNAILKHRTPWWTEQPQHA